MSLSFEKISRELNIPVWKVKNIYFSGLNKLKKKISEDPTLREELLTLLENNTRDNHVDLIKNILYDNYGRDKI